MSVGKSEFLAILFVFFNNFRKLFLFNASSLNNTMLLPIILKGFYVSVFKHFLW